jgi:hypothetical protein
MLTALNWVDLYPNYLFEFPGLNYFIDLSISRYGWIPELSDIDENTRRKYDWVPGISITHMEILHGAFR